MSERTITISPYAKEDSLIDLKGYVSIEGVTEIIEIPEKKHLILYNYSLTNDEVVLPREHNFLRIYLKPELAKGKSINDFSNLLINGEIPDRVLKLKLQVSCKTTRWCSNQLSINLNEINGGKEIYFDIPTSDVKDEITISGFIIRAIGIKKDELRKANAIYSVLSNCEDITIQIDERKDIGGNHLPFDYEDLKSKHMVFEIKGLENDFELPRIKCAKEFQEYFVRDDLKTVNSSFMMAMFYFLDSYLKWLIFKCRYDSHDKRHKALIETLARYCGISKTELIELIQEKKYSEHQTKNYLSISHKLFCAIQVDTPFKYAKELKRMIKNELK